jgi:hypothetical protein
MQVNDALSYDPLLTAEQVQTMRTFVESYVGPDDLDQGLLADCDITEYSASFSVHAVGLSLAMHYNEAPHCELAFAPGEGFSIELWQNMRVPVGFFVARRHLLVVEQNEDEEVVEGRVQDDVFKASGTFVSTVAPRPDWRRYETMPEEEWHTSIQRAEKTYTQQQESMATAGMAEHSRGVLQTFVRHISAGTITLYRSTH